MWSKIISFASKYGPKAVKWCWKHKGTLLNAGLHAYDIIVRMFG
ncbi:MAG: aureocin A53 family class IId bacteriocin [Paraclostridium sordellii]